jgi:Zn finger protein HypA/HybF involved in hydrogenase expression
MVFSAIGCGREATMSSSPHDIAEIVRRFSRDYSTQFGDVRLPSQKKAIFDIATCQTKVRGGRRFRCEDCDHSFWVYHGCRNRSCPKCHSGQLAAWLADREVELLPCPYFHLIATVPEELRPVFLKHQKFMYGLLMNIVSTEVIALAREQRFIGATPAILAVLHTWNGRLGFHPHVHLLVSGGGVSDDGAEWHESNASFLVPVKLLSLRIAESFKKAIKAKRPELLKEIPDKAWKANWCSFCVPYGRGEKAVLNYLGRYVFRTAITNHRIVDVTETNVTFRYKDRKTNAMQTETVTGIEFLRRFLIHVLPKGFHKVRYYGLWHASKKPLQMAARVLLIFRKPTGKEPPLLTSDVPNVETLEAEKRYGECCPKCGSERLELTAECDRTMLPLNRPEVFLWLETLSRGDP